MRQSGGTRLLGYTRVSPTRQDAQLQLGALMSAGMQKRDVFAEVTSGSKTAVQRPGMKKLLEYAETGDTVVVWRVDRLARSLIDVLKTVNLLRDRGVHVRSVSDGIDTATPTGRLMLNMLATLAEYERELIVERVNAGIAAARQSGTRFGRLAVDPAVIADKLAVVTDACAKGRTAEDAARLVGWSRATLYPSRAPHSRRRIPSLKAIECRLRAIDDTIGGFVSGPSVMLRGPVWHANWRPDGGSSGGDGQGPDHDQMMQLCRRLSAGQSALLPTGSEALVNSAWVD